MVGVFVLCLIVGVLDVVLLRVELIVNLIAGMRVLLILFGFDVMIPGL